jgi:hypothetical protein
MSGSDGSVADERLLFWGLVGPIKEFELYPKKEEALDSWFNIGE